MARVKPPMLTGQQIGKWSVGAAFQHPTRNERMYQCVCECGTEKPVKHFHLASGKTSSCGCSAVTHGMAKSKEYRVWDSMVRRCHNQNHHAFKNYGARGIAVCDEWKKFDGFYADMGAQPDGMTLERINNDFGYCKENCRWATVAEQARNRRTTKLNQGAVEKIKQMLEEGIRQTVIAAQFGVSRTAISHISCGTTWRN